MIDNFVHLNVHSDYSLVDSTIRINNLIKQAKKLNFKALALTDLMNCFGWVKFYRGCVKAGIKPILGAEILIENSENINQPYKMILLCQNLTGYQNLLRLISHAYIHSQQHHQQIVINKNFFIDIKNSENLTDLTDLLAISGGLESDIGQAIFKNNLTQLKKNILFWSALFPKRFYLEATRVDYLDSEIYLKIIRKLSLIYNLPLVATNSVRFLEQSDFESHEARVAIAQGRLVNDRTRPRNYTSKQFLRSTEEMTALFNDIPEALINASEIAKRCTVKLDFNQTWLPKFEIINNAENISIEDYLKISAREGLEKRFAAQQNNNHKINKNNKLIYQQRLAIELDIIIQMGFADYFLIVADFVQWAHQQNIPVGPGRGSGVGSIVAWALYITEIDPLKHNLLFERFLNPERVSLPDFDIDFCIEGRDRVIDYVVKRYGRERVAQIVTFGTMAARAVLRDVGRTLGFPYRFVDTLAKLIPMELGMTLDRALSHEESLKTRYEQEENVKNILDIARSLEGLTRNVSTHAGGLVIAPRPLTEFTALYCESTDANKDYITQFDKDDIESIGLVKFDFLGLRNLTVLHHAVTQINLVNLNNNLNINQLPATDNKTFELLQQGQAKAIFQFESRTMQDLLRKLQPNCFEDIVNLTALNRPGPLQSGMVQEFIDRRHNRVSFDYEDKRLEKILQSTYGVILYQEQVMQIAQEIAGYSLGRADLLRRAMGKKKHKEMEEQRSQFLAGAIKNRFDESKAAILFDQMEKFAGYGFNRSHAVAYSLITYQTAFLKANYPAAFMAAVLSSEMAQTEKIALLLKEAMRLNLKIIYPDINLSDYYFKVDEKNNNQIIYGLGAIRGIGQNLIESLVQERKLNGDYQDFFDFCSRNNPKKLNKRALLAFIAAGVFDRFKLTRRALYENLDEIMRTIQDLAEKRANYNFSFLDLLTPDASNNLNNDINNIVPPNLFKKLNDITEWTDIEKLKQEKIVLGSYVTGHPITRYLAEFSGQKFQTISALKLLRTTQDFIILPGVVSSVKIFEMKNHRLMARVIFEDGSDILELALFSEIYTQFKSIIQPDAVLFLEGRWHCDLKNRPPTFITRNIFTPERARLHWGDSFMIELPDYFSEKQLVKLFKILQNNINNTNNYTYAEKTLTVKIKTNINNYEVILVLDKNKIKNIIPSDQLLEQFNQDLQCRSYIITKSSDL